MYFYRVNRLPDIETDFEIDKLTNSIENTITGEVFDTEVTRLYSNETSMFAKHK